MANDNLPDSEESKDPKNERKLPEFIYIDSGHPEDPDPKLGSTPHQQEAPKIFGSIEHMAKGSQPFYFRILAFFGMILVLLGSVFLLACFLFYLVCSLLLLRQADYLNESTSKCWRFFKKLLVFALGCFVMMFNFSFGVGIILMYLMLTGESISNSFVNEFTKPRQ